MVRVSPSPSLEFNHRLSQLGEEKGFETPSGKDKGGKNVNFLLPSPRMLCELSQLGLGKRISFETPSGKDKGEGKKRCKLFIHD
ncbi:MAG: hypothetical protein IPL53_15130 [Ignavibacteria bacterium]|nr:hypothetical protein [Ignavibacteria bacterium]